MYYMVINTGEVYKEGNILIAPCQDISEPNYIEYIKWVESGNSPVECYSLGDEYEFNNGNFVMKMDVLKQNKLAELNVKFEEQFQYGKFVCSLGFTVDNRRYGDKNDKDNMQSLLDIGMTVFKDADGNFHNVTVDDLQTIKLEMTQDGLKKYQTKWYYEGIINGATDQSQLLSLDIKF